MLVGVLGSGKWEPVRYVLPGVGEYESDYATFALKKLLEGEGRDFDKIVIFGVETAAWKFVERYFPEAERVVIPEARNEREVEDIFRIMSGSLSQERPELILDLTHGYRHQPLFLLLCAFYLEMLDIVRIERAYYAMLPFGERRAEFLDLNPFISLLRTTKRVKIFHETMHITGLEEIEEEIREARNRLGREGRIEEAKRFNEIEKTLRSLEKLGLFISVNYTPGIAEIASDFGRKLGESLPFVGENYPYLLPALQVLKEETERLGRLAERPLWEAQLGYAEKCFKLGRYTSAAVNLREGMLTRICYLFSGCSEKDCEKGEDCSHRELREKISGYMSSIARNDLITPDERMRRLARLYEEIAQFRNKLCHGFIGHREEIKREEIIERLQDFIDKFRKEAS